MHAPVDFERLIELVRPYPFLFDRNEPDFKDVALKNQRWRLIGAEFGISGEHAAQKFRTMKTKYKDLRRAHEAATGNRSKPPRWRYYKLMDDFLRERYLPEHMASPAGMVISNIRSFAELQTEDAAARSASHVSSAEVAVIVSSLYSAPPHTTDPPPREDSGNESNIEETNGDSARPDAPVVAPEAPRGRGVSMTNSFRLGLLATSVMGVVLLLHLLLATINARNDKHDTGEVVYMAPQQNPNESPLVAAAAVAAVPTSSIEGADCSALVGFEGCDPWRAEAAHRWFYFARGSCWPWEPRRPMCAAGRNRFRTTEDCREVCEHGADARSRLDCTSAVYPRRCDVMGSWVFPYYYDWAKARCLHHRGRSCLLAPNRFRAFVECNRACAACPNCTDERCEAAILSGDCSLELKAFQAYFDTRTQTCRPWTDICLAPPNRFRNESECQRRCLSRH